MRIAVVGSGIAGLSAAWLLQPQHQVTLFEADARAGGHSNTIDVTLNGISHPVDTGFLVHNDRTYPNLVQLFTQLGIDTPDSEMTFSVSLPAHDLEWAGADLTTLFAQPRNLLRPAFWRMLLDILRFNRESTELLEQLRGRGITLGQLLDAGRYSREFREWYLLPMGAAIWSSPLGGMNEFPAETFLQFCINHGLLQIFDRPQWKCIRNGSREYVHAMLDRLPDVRLSTPVRRIVRQSGGIMVSTDQGGERFDIAVLACHSDQALSILADASPSEHDVLANVRYQQNTAWLHTDDSLMPARRRTWSAWNYYSRQMGTNSSPVAVTYWLNRLQPLPFRDNVFVTLNPPLEPASDRILQRIDYTHPVLDSGAWRAQQKLPAIQGRDSVYFCGAWTGYGFHEDGLKSGMQVASLLGANIPWNG